MTFPADILVVLNIILGVLMTFILFLLKDIKDDIKIQNRELLNHVSNFDLHCSQDKFRARHTSLERG